MAYISNTNRCKQKVYFQSFIQAKKKRKEKTSTMFMTSIEYSKAKKNK